MVQDGHDIEDVQDDPGGPAAEPVSRTLLFGGVAVACALGAGLGLWARPIAGESPQAARPAVAVLPQAPVARRLHVVVDEGLPPPSAPLEVMPSTPPPEAPIAPVPLAPRRPPNGLVRVDAPVPGPLALAPAPRSAPPARPAARPVEIRAVRTAKADHPRPTLKRHPQKLAKSIVPKRPHRVETAETRREHESEPRRALLALAHAVRQLAPHHAHQAERAAAGPMHKPVVRKAAMRPAQRKPELKEARSVRVASINTRCASSDPGEALTCGDPALGAAERRMDRAYREAEAAGVPRARLEAQQQRWLAARAAAAREAPWAVRDVYQARIAELQDMAHNPGGD